MHQITNWLTGAYKENVGMYREIIFFCDEFK